MDRTTLYKSAIGTLESAVALPSTGEEEDKTLAAMIFLLKQLLVEFRGA